MLHLQQNYQGDFISYVVSCQLELLLLTLICLPDLNYLDKLVEL